MKLISNLFFFICLSSQQAYSFELISKAIYGDDNRFDIYQVINPLYKQIARSSMSQIYLENLEIQDNGTFKLKGFRFYETGICETERFSNQWAASGCSGFLVAPDKLLTAGHCVQTIEDCQKAVWVFDYAHYIEENKDFFFKEQQIYRCTEIIAHKNTERGADFSLVRLDKVVNDRRPLKLRNTGKVANAANLAMIGNPAGLPLKLVTKIKLRKNSSQDFFVTNADSYGGNSGSAVFDEKTGLVEGILVRGGKDFLRTEEGCHISRLEGEYKGRGEDVARVSALTWLLNK